MLLRGTSVAPPHIAVLLRGAAERKAARAQRRLHRSDAELALGRLAEDEE